MSFVLSLNQPVILGKAKSFTALVRPSIPFRISYIYCNAPIGGMFLIESLACANPGGWSAVTHILKRLMNS